MPEDWEVPVGGDLVCAAADSIERDVAA